MPKPINNPMRLPHLQHQFAQQMIAPKGDGDISTIGDLLAESHYSPKQLINIYHNNYVISLIQLLEQIFPATKALVGADFFAQSSRQFIQHKPLTEPHLNYYGGSFVGFLKTLKSLEAMPFVAQIAQLEWHLDRVSHMYHVPQFDFEKLATVAQHQVVQLIFKLAKICYLQTSVMGLISLHFDLCAPPTTTDNNDINGQSEQPNYQQHSYI
ncbi:MAG: DUF2063 domain-containing protein [Oceanospirillaceae bacterium]|jgi:hypothetical protein|nr:DUF2063 domain-containing protein [Oceanospirillaceae bacterium]